MWTNIELHQLPKDAKLTIDQLACALYEGTPHIGNLAEKLARQYGKANTLSFYDLMDNEIKNFWRTIALQIIEHSSHWLPNEGSFCILDEAETKRLKSMSRVKV